MSGAGATADRRTGGVEFGEYRLLRRLGAGGMAEVFLAKRLGPRGFEKQLVIKRILPHLTASERFSAMFLNEARLAALIDHPNLVHVSSFGEIEGNYYLAMEYVDGITVAELLELAGSLTPGVAARIAIEILGALHAIHTARDPDGKPLGLVHRDVSPRNVMITRDGTVKLLDFGIAVAKDDAPNAELMGTKRYMSPEQMFGDVLDARSDLFSLGVLLFHMATGTAPYEGIPARVPPQPRSIPDALWSAVSSAIAIRVNERPESARQLQSQLELFVASRGIEGTRSHLADVVSALSPDPRLNLRAISRITQRTMTRILRLTVPLAGEPSSPGAGARKRAHPALRIGLLMVLAMMLGSATVLVVHTVRARPTVEPLAETALPVAPPPPVETATVAAQVVEAAPPPEPEVARERPARSAKTRAPRRQATGTLTIDTRPWTEVYLGERKLGLTPMEGVKLPTGRHELELRNPSLGLVKRITVTIRPGRVTRVQRVL